MGINGEAGRRGRLVLLLPLRRVVVEEDEEDEDEELEAEISAVWILLANSFFFSSSSSSSCFSSPLFFCALFCPNFVEFKVAGKTQLHIHPASKTPHLRSSSQTQTFNTIHDTYLLEDSNL